jgi:hypothetical protein
VHLVCVPTHQAKQAWDLVGHHIVRAMKRGGIGDAGPVYADVVAGRSQFWVALNATGVAAAAVTDLTEAMGRKICTIVACGGDERANWLHLIEGLEDFARAEGCEVTRIIGRKGWSRVLPDYQTTALVLEKAL